MKDIFTILLIKEDMDKRQEQPRNGACDNYRWSFPSAFKKLTSNGSVNVGPFSKQITGPNNPEKNAYRNCLNCDKHFNYHSKTDNSYNTKQFDVFNPSKKK